MKEEYVKRGAPEKPYWKKLKKVGDTVKLVSMTDKEAISMRSNSRRHGVKLSILGLATGGYRVTVGELVKE